MNAKDFRFFYKTRYEYNVVYNDYSSSSLTSTERKVFDSIEEAVSYAYSEGYTFRDSRGKYRRPNSKTYWVEITPIKEELSSFWGEDGIFEYLETTKYVGEKHAAAYLIATTVKEKLNERTEFKNYSMRYNLESIRDKVYYELIAPNEENKDFVDYLVAKNFEGLMAKFYEGDEEGFSNFLLTSFALTVKEEVEEITKMLLGGKDEEILFSSFLRNLFKYVNKEYDSKWL